MKYLILLLLYPCLVSAQKKDDNTIVISGITRDQVIKVFKQNGYIIDKATNLKVATVPKKTSTGIFVLEISIMEGNTGYLMGTFNSNSISSTGTDSTAAKNKNEPFLIMDSVARSFGKPITYTLSL